MLKIKFLKAFNGDCILLTLQPNTREEKCILIDGGSSSTYISRKKSKKKSEYGALKILTDQLREHEKIIDLLILTHVDDDHIAGILEWFENDAKAYELIKEVWFNSGTLIAQHFKAGENADLDPEFKLPNLGTDTSIPQGIRFGKYILEKKIWKQEIFMQGKDTLWNNAEFKFLSPNENKLEHLLKEWKKSEATLDTSLKIDDYNISIEHFISIDKFEEDKAFPNGSSIAFIFTFENRNYLFLGDSHPSVIVEGLSKRGFSKKFPLTAEMVKLSHHGSRGNTNVELLEMVNSSLYIVSTNGQSHLHPHKQLLARLINCKPGCTLYFNYTDRMNRIFLPEDFHYLPFTITNIPDEFVLDYAKR
jgi:beta-lactamase superfamily II metal-dependent hydrolase